ncbi:hypothetical protein SAMN04487830_10613 [Pseudobutyrivibrio sp. OR37]|uniref:hypothetical protein n=1 Tax=Pseudobutyrivibrio sp. OR37 TaxID=1798186 RepID=UPI0008F1FFBE|nr:hypothetical protein [Pseudobutyrivibrio sp. OR37]SFH70899.1 hypothetical protein SAMN04487830_10613 [Pseudobutyrivibrio sp. OR37]
MVEVKYHLGKSKIHNVTLDDFVETTKKKAPHYSIDNPADMLPINTEILQLAHDYFDKCIYIIRKTTGLVISDNLAERIARDYMAHPGYMTYDVTRENVPYIMDRCMTGIGLVKRKIEKDSPIYKLLESKKEISLVPDGKTKTGIQLYRIESTIGYLELMFNVSNYKFRGDSTSGLKEYLKLHIGIPDGNGTYDTYSENEIEVDPFFFNKMIYSKRPLPPRPEIVDIANKYLVI